MKIELIQSKAYAELAWLACTGPWSLSPTARQIIGQDKSHQQGEPEHSSSGKQQREPLAVAQVHEVNRHQQRFDDCDSKPDDGVPAGAKIDESRAGGGQSQCQQSAENDVVSFYRDHRWRPSR